MSHAAELPAGHHHHFEPEQAYHASKLGMWLFLVTEIHLFAGLFCAFFVYRWHYPELFSSHAHQLSWKLGALNTAVLLISSYFMVRGVDAAQKGENLKCKRWIDLTIAFAFIFFIVKFIEYSGKFSHGIYPDVDIFWGLYFTMTGLHGLHVAVGIGLLWWLRQLAKKERFSTVYYTPVEVGGLYWHLVDVIWIFLFPIVYLLAGVQ